MTQNVSDFIWHRLSEWGLKRVYGYPGDGVGSLDVALDRRFGEAEHWSRRSLADNPTWAGTRRYHAAALAELGRLDEARAEIAALLQVQPNSSIARSRLNSFRHGWMYDLYLGALRAAGLPEA